MRGAACLKLIPNFTITGNSFNGELDDLRFYDRTYTATEVAQLYEYESAAPTVKPIDEWIENGLVAFYPFSGDFDDYSGNGHHGVNNFNLRFDEDYCQEMQLSFENQSGLDLPNPEAFMLGNSFTISMVLQMPNPQNDNFHILTNNHWLKSNGYALSIRDGGVIDFMISSGGTQSNFGGVYHSSRTATKVLPNTIYHLAFTYNGSIKKCISTVRNKKLQIILTGSRLAKISSTLLTGWSACNCRLQSQLRPT